MWPIFGSLLKAEKRLISSPMKRFTMSLIFRRCRWCQKTCFRYFLTIRCFIGREILSRFYKNFTPKPPKKPRPSPPPTNPATKTTTKTSIQWKAETLLWTKHLGFCRPISAIPASGLYFNSMSYPNSLTGFNTCPPRRYLSFRPHSKGFIF